MTPDARLRASFATDTAYQFAAPGGCVPYPFQRAGVEFSTSLRDCIIADEPGLGKTIQAIGWLNMIGARRPLIVCPASLRINWRRELAKWAIWDPETTVASYNEVSKGLGACTPWDAVVYDEAHYMKTADSRRTERGLALRTPRRLFLSGTPIANRPIEIWPLLRAMEPEVWGNRTDFGMTYCGGRWDGYEWNFSGSSNLVDLQRRLRSTLMVRRMKSAVLKDLPAKTRQLIELPAESTCKTGELLAAVRQIWKAQQSALTPEAVARLRCDKEVVRAQLSKVRHEEALAKVPAAAAHINDLAESVEKIVVFAHHRDVIAALAGGLKGKAVLLQGGMSDHEKQTSVDQFQTDAGTRFLVGNIEAAGVGYTLTAAHTVVFAELDWVPGRMNQCEDRCHRIGQKDNVLVQHLVLDGSLDARISRALQRKQAVIDQALNGEAAPAELDWVATLAEPEKE